MFFVKDLVLRGCFFNSFEITVVIYRYMVCWNIIRVVFGIGISGKTYWSTGDWVKFWCKISQNLFTSTFVFFFLKNLIKQIKSRVLCLGKSKIDGAEPLKHW